MPQLVSTDDVTFSGSPQTMFGGSSSASFQQYVHSPDLEALYLWDNDSSFSIPSEFFVFNAETNNKSMNCGSDFDT